MTFILAGHKLVTVRYDEPRPFAIVDHRLARNCPATATGETILMDLLDAVIDRSADILERIGADVDPSKTEWTLEEAAQAVDAIFVGVELAGSPLATINDLGPTVVASDFGNNGGLIVGPEVQDWRDRLDAIEVETIINGVSVGVGGSASLQGGVIESVRFLL